MVGMIYFFVYPRHSFLVDRFGDQLATAMFFFCGTCCAGLGDTQRVSRQRAEAALAIALEGKAEMEEEVARRKGVEEALRQSEAILRAFYDSAPINMGIVEPLQDDVLHVYDNAASCRFFGVKPGETVGRRATELGTPPEVLRLWLTNYGMSGAQREPVVFEYEYDAAWTTLALRDDQSNRPGYNMVAQVCTLQKMTADAMWKRRSERANRAGR